MLNSKSLVVLGLVLSTVVLLASANPIPVPPIPLKWENVTVHIDSTGEGYDTAYVTTILCVESIWSESREVTFIHPFWEEENVLGYTVTTGGEEITPAPTTLTLDMLAPFLEPAPLEAPPVFLIPTPPERSEREQIVEMAKSAYQWEITLLPGEQRYIAIHYQQQVHPVEGVYTFEQWAPLKGYWLTKGGYIDVEVALPEETEVRPVVVGYNPTPTDQWHIGNRTKLRWIWQGDPSIIEVSYKYQAAPEMAYIVISFLDEERNPYPFDVTISDGTWRKEFKNVTYIETEVPCDASYNLRWSGLHGTEYEYEAGDNIWLSIPAGEVKEFDFYLDAMEDAVITPTTNVEPYVFFVERGANLTFSYEYFPDDKTLIINISGTEGRYVGWGFPLKILDPLNQTVYLGVLPESPAFLVTKTEEVKHPWWHYIFDGWGWGCIMDDIFSGKTKPKSTVSFIYYFDEIDTTLGKLRIMDVFHNDRWFPFNATLTSLEDPSIKYETDCHTRVPEFYNIPLGSYLLTIYPYNILDGGHPTLLPVTLSVNIVAGLRAPNLYLYSFTADDLEPCTFSIAAESPVAESSYSNLTHDEETNTLSVDVSTETAYDWWGYFVLPEAYQVKSILAYDYDYFESSAPIPPLSELTDYTVNRVEGYNIVVVRIEPAVRQVSLQYEEEEVNTCYVDFANQVNTCQLDGIVWPYEPNGGINWALSQAVMKINMANHQALEMKIEVQNPGGDWLLNIGNSPSNNGAGGDGGDFSNDSEIDITKDTEWKLRVYGNDYSTGAGIPRPLLVTNEFITREFIDSGKETIRVKIGDERLWIKSEVRGNEAALFENEYIFRLGATDDECGGVDYQYYVAFNRTIGSPWRTGTGVTKVTFLWSNTWTWDWEILDP